jgi:hypothetical protein
MNRGLILLALIFVAASASQAKDEGNVEDMMERTHKGRRSPYRQLEQQLEAKLPQWPVIDQQLPTFGRMGEALQKSRKEEVCDLADGYVDAVNELAKAARTRNLANFRKAFASLKNSCADCHDNGGPGGKLD